MTAKATAPPTIILLEIPPAFTASNGDRPETTSAPFFKAFCDQYGFRFIHRAVRAHADLTAWCKSLKNSRLGSKRIVVVSGHGVEASRSKRVGIVLPHSNRLLLPHHFTDAFAEAGNCLSGFLFDVCHFGKNRWEPPTGKFTIAFSKYVFWMNSLFTCFLALENIYAAQQPPKNGKDVKNRYVQTVFCGRTKMIEHRVSYRDWVQQIGVVFGWRERGNWNWIDGDPSR